MAPHARSTVQRSISREVFAGQTRDSLPIAAFRARLVVSFAKYVARVYPVSLYPDISSPPERTTYPCAARISNGATLSLLSLSLGVEWERERANATVDRFAVRRDEGGRAPPRPARGCACARGIGTSSSSDRKAEDDDSEPNKDLALYLLERSSERARDSDKRKRNVEAGANDRREVRINVPRWLRRSCWSPCAAATPVAHSAFRCSAPRRRRAYRPPTSSTISSRIHRRPTAAR